MEQRMALLMLYHTPAAIMAGFFLDLIFGDPERLYHPVRLIGRLVSLLDGALRDARHESGRQFFRGFFLALVVPAVSGLAAYELLKLFYGLHFAAGFILECVMCWQIIAVKSMKDAAMEVYGALTGGVSGTGSEPGGMNGTGRESGGEKTGEDIEPACGEERLPEARQAVSMIVGRDTERLSEEGVVKAAVESVAESTADGIIAPLFFTALFGPAGGWVYKAVNTMDSMIGYKNEKYLFFGRAAARMDDVLGFLPARLSALIMILMTIPSGLDTRGAVRIFFRDRKKHASPNSAQTESVMAGALGLRLAGDAYYFGKPVRKPFIGDERRKAEPEDICRAVRLMMETASFGMCLAVLCSIAVTLYFISVGEDPHFLSGGL